MGFVPDLVHISEAACNDKTFLGHLDVAKGGIYIFDKGYVNYPVWRQWTKSGVFYLTRLNENASYDVLEGEPNHISEYANGGVISDQKILLKGGSRKHVWSYSRIVKAEKCYSSYTICFLMKPLSNFTNTDGTLRYSSSS